MAVRSRALVPSTASRMFVQARRDGFGNMAGVVSCPYLGATKPFEDVMAFTRILDEWMDGLQFPQAAMQYRGFSPKPGRGKKAPTQPATSRKVVPAMESPTPLNGHEEDVFVVHVQFRQNATWQGTVKCAGQSEELRFRSTLELLKIMDSALAERHPEE